MLFNICRTLNFDVFQIAKEYKDIEGGHLDQKHQPEALRNLSKRCKVCCEDYMKTLEKLDSFTFEDHQAGFRVPD